jgi:hypothetical protein
LLLEHARERIQAVLSEIRKLQAAEFAYDHPRLALDQLRRHFEDNLKRLRRLDVRSDPEVVKNVCAVALDEVFRFLPLLGFLLRSTNVRNAFEVLGPLSRLAETVLPPVPGGNDPIRLVVSSEWEYSPLTYSDIPSLPGFLLIGFPAAESANPHLIPLAGHEIGHPLAASLGLDREFKPRITKAVLAQIRADPETFKSVYRVGSVDDIENSLFLRELWRPAVAWAAKQTEETFCDYVGVRLFGGAYLFAFAYLLSPGPTIERSPRYPSLPARIANLVKAMKALGYAEVPGFEDAFSGQDGRREMTRAEGYCLGLADAALATVEGEVLQYVMDALKQAAGPSPPEIDRVLGRYRFMVPAENCRTLADILNAGWRAHEDEGLWSDTGFYAKRQEILRELVLKNIEVYEIEQTLAEHRNAS